MSETVPVSVLLLTLNEEENLPRCLAALDWCDDVVVLDSLSLDRTVEIATAGGARVVVRAFDDFATQRNFGLETLHFDHEWVLHLDADEIVTPELLSEIEKAVRGGDLDAYRIPAKLIFQARWLRYAGMYPTYQVRLTRRGAFRFRQVGHGQKEDVPAERVGTIEVPYLHYAFSRGLEEWFAKHNRYSTAEAEAACQERAVLRLGDLFGSDAYRRRQALRAVSQRLPCRPLLRFLYMFVLRKGFLDGNPGLTYCRMLAIYEAMIVLKEKEIRRASAEAK